MVVYPPPPGGGYWRVRWREEGRRRETTARSRDAAVARASDLVARLGLGAPTNLRRAPGSALVTHYLDPARRPARGRAWSERHREEQEAYCRRFVTPVIGSVECGGLTRADFQRILERAVTRSVAEHLRRCLTALVAAGLEEGYLLARQDVLRGVHSYGGPAGEQPTLELGRLVEAADIPTATAVRALAAAAGEHTRVWWHQLQILLVAYSGLRWGEQAALTADRVDAARRRIVVDRQVLETRRDLKLAPPKSRRRRTTMFPARTPEGVDLAGLLDRRLGELAVDGLLFPSPRDGGRGARTTAATSSTQRLEPQAGPDATTRLSCGRSTRYATCSRPGPSPSRVPGSKTSPASWATPLCASPRTSASPLRPTSTTASTKHGMTARSPVEVGPKCRGCSGQRLAEVPQELIDGARRVPERR